MQIDLTDTPAPADRDAILAPMRAHTLEQTGTNDPGGNFAILLRDAEGKVEGGAFARHWMGAAKLEYMFVPAPRRGAGLGRRLLATLEHAAIARGCATVWMTSFSMQAPEFYETCGYRVAGRIEDRPPGHAEVYLSKESGLGAEPATLVVDWEPDPAHRETLRLKLRAHTDAIVPPSGSRDLAILVRGADGTTQGGLWGHTGRGWLHVDLLALPPELRRGGLGARLLGMAEEEARARGCIGSCLDTFNYQARPFYEKLGYSVFGQVNNTASGTTRFLLSKRWAA